MSDRHLHIVDVDTGEKLDECPTCAELREKVQTLRDQLAGAEKDINAWRTRHANLRRDKEKAARKERLWPLAARLFVIWKNATDNTSTRSTLTFDRYEKIKPFLKGSNTDHDKLSYDASDGPPRNQLEECAAAIIGRVSDHFTATRSNGTTKRYWEWERIFKDSGEFAESLSRRPQDWRARLLPLDTAAPARPEGEQLPMVDLESAAPGAGHTTQGAAVPADTENARQKRSQAL